jgi:hypothetical protein
MGNAATKLAFDQHLQQAATRPYPCLILRPTALQGQDVVPGAHGHAAIDSHRADGRMRKYEAQADLAVETQLRHQWLEVVAVRAQPMQPDDTALRLGVAHDLNRFR